MQVQCKSGVLIAVNLNKNEGEKLELYTLDMKTF